MWDEVGQALKLSMTKMLSHLAGLLPGILALVGGAGGCRDCVGSSGYIAAVARRFRVRPQGHSMGLPGGG